MWVCFLFPFLGVWLLVFGDLELCCERYLLEDLEVSGFLGIFHLELSGIWSLLELELSDFCLDSLWLCVFFCCQHDCSCSSKSGLSIINSGCCCN